MYFPSFNIDVQIRIISSRRKNKYVNLLPMLLHGFKRGLQDSIVNFARQLILYLILFDANLSM